MDINQAIKEAANVFIVEQSGETKVSLNDSVIEALKLYVTNKGGTPASRSINDLVNQASAYYFTEQSVSPAPRGNDAIFAATYLYLTTNSQNVPQSLNQRLLTSAEYFIANGSTSVLTPTTLQSSVVHRSATYNFSVPVPVGTYADGSPFVVSDRVFTITSITPASSLVASTDYIDSQTLLNVTGASFAKNGAMVNPWFYGAYEGTEPQGFDGMLGTTYNGAAWRFGLMTYSAGLNIDPGIAGAYSVAIGHETSIVKSVRRSGLINIATDTNWRLFDDWCVLHIVQTTPAAGAFPPPVVATSKASLFKLSQVNKGCLGSGWLTVSTGMPTHAATVAGDNFRPVQPYWGQNGEQRRRMIVEMSSNAGNLTTYSRDFGRKWSDALAALLQQGSSGADDTLFRNMLTFGNDLIGGLNRGFAEVAGAGQASGHKQFAMLLGHAVPSFMPNALEVQGNVSHQNFWTPAALVNTPSVFPGGGGDHYGYFFSARDEHVGRPHWAIEVSGGTGTRPATASTRYDFNTDADYEIASGLASLVEMVNIGLMKAGPSNWDGSQNIAGSATTITATEGGASLAYFDRYRQYVVGTDIFSATNTELILGVEHRNYYDDHRDDMAIGRWTGTPDEITPSKYAGTAVAGTVAVSNANATVTGTGTAFDDVYGHVVGGYIATGTGEVRQITAIASDTSMTVASPFAASSASTTHTPYLSILYPTASGGFGWDFSAIGMTTLPILEYEVQFSHDDRSWRNVTTQAGSGTQTGLIPGLTYKVRVRRRNSAGWSPWSHNWPLVSTNLIDRNIVKILGTPSGAVTNTVAPAIFQRTYPATQMPIFSAATSPVALNNLSVKLFCGVGTWTGNVSGSPTYQWERNGLPISGATSDSYTLTSADNNPSAVTDITCDVTWSGVTATSNTVVVPIATAAQQWIARMDVAPTGALLTLINTFCADAVSSGAWAKLDGIWAGLHTAQASRVNAKGSSYTLTHAGTTTPMTDSDFTAHRGYQPVSSTDKHLTVGFSENTSGLNWGQNSAVLGCHVNADGGGTTGIMGTISSSNTAIVPYNVTNIRAKVFSASNALVSAGAANRLGWAAGIRTSSTSSKAMNADSTNPANGEAAPGGVTFGTDIGTTATTPVATGMTLFRATSAYSSDRAGFWFIGGGFSEVQLEAFIDDVAGPFVAGLLAL